MGSHSKRYNTGFGPKIFRPSKRETLWVLLTSKPDHVFSCFTTGKPTMVRYNFPRPTRVVRESWPSRVIMFFASGRLKNSEPTPSRILLGLVGRQCVLGNVKPLGTPVLPAGFVDVNPGLFPQTVHSVFSNIGTDDLVDSCRGDLGIWSPVRTSTMPQRDAINPSRKKTPHGQILLNSRQWPFLKF